MKKLYLLFLLTILALVAYGQTSKTINVETAGSLPTLISEDEKYTIEELTLTGNLNGTDFRLLRDMAGCNYLGDETSGKLKVLDISNVKIVLGGDKYIDTDHLPDMNGNFRYSVDEKDILPSCLFAGCKVTNVILPTSINKIGVFAFLNCYGLLSMNIPEGVTSIDQFAFSGCKSLTTLSFPSTVSYISQDALGRCTSMQNYLVDSNNEYFSSSSGILFNKDKTILLSYPIGRTDTEFSIPDGVISTGNDAFADSPYLVEVIMPNTLSMIGINAFSNCKSLTSIVIPNSVTTIGNSAFYGCKNLKSITIPNSVTTIQDCAFHSTGLTSIEIPSSVTSIGSSVFRVCSSLSEIKVVSDNQHYCSSFGVLFDKDMKTLICFPAGNTRTDYVIPDGVTNIAYSAFYACQKLQSITIPNSISDIGVYAFEACQSLNYVYSYIEEPFELEEYSFCTDAFNNATLYVPMGKKAQYQAKAHWNKFTTIEEMPAYYNGFYFKLNNNEAEIVAGINQYDGYAGEIIIPETVEFEGVSYPVTSIGNCAFWGCKNLTSVFIPKSIKSIGESIIAFSSISSIAVEAENPVFDSRDDCNAIIETGSNKLVVACINTIIPNTVTEIGTWAFDGIDGLTSITIPKSVTKINKWSIATCWDMRTIYCYAEDVPQTHYYAFKEWPLDQSVLYVPSACIDAYKAVEPWNKFMEIKAIESDVEPLTMQETPLTFEAIEGTVQISFYNRWSNSSFPFKYSIDNGPWKEFTAPIDGNSSLPESGKIVRLKSTKELAYWYSWTNSNGEIGKYFTIKCDADCYVYGNIMSIYKGDDFATNTDLGEFQGFGPLFRNNTHLRNHPEKSLVLPSTTLNIGCYREMFSGCTGLTKAPELPATILESYCYNGMFKGCSNINEIVCKAIDISAENCTIGWLDGVSATGTFYKDVTMTDWTEGVNGIPTGWTVKEFNTKVEKDDVVYTPKDEDHTVTVSDGGDSSTEIVIQSNISINGQSYEVTAIGDCAFQNNELVVKVTIPETIASIGAKAFSGCTNLKSISIYVKVPINLPGAAASRTRGDGGSSVFAGVDTETCVLYVPAGSGDAYRSADGWKDFKNIVEMASSIGIKVAKGMTTYTSEHNLDFSSLGDDVKAYVATGYDYDKNTIWLTRVKDVPAGTPILVQAPASDTPYEVPVKASSGCYYKNMLVGNLSGAEITLSATTGDMTNYYLSNGMFLTATGSNTIGNGKAYLQIPTTPPAATVGSSQAVKLNDYGFASFCGSQDLDFTDVEGLKAFAVTGYDDANGTIWLTRVKRVSARTPLLLKGGSGASYTVPSVAVGSYYANMMKGNLSGSTITIYTTDGDMTNYYLKGNQLLKATAVGNTIGNGKAYMQIPSKHVTRSIEDIVADLLIYGISGDEPEVISIPVVRGLNGDGTTGIHSIENGKLNIENDVYYNLQGQRVENPTKGLYIKGGKKVLIK